MQVSKISTNRAADLGSRGFREIAGKAVDFLGLTDRTEGDNLAGSRLQAAWRRLGVNWLYSWQQFENTRQIYSRMEDGLY